MSPGDLIGPGLPTILGTKIDPSSFNINFVMSEKYRCFMRTGDVGIVIQQMMTLNWGERCHVVIVLHNGSIGWFFIKDVRILRRCEM